MGSVMKISFVLRKTPRTTVQDFKTAVSAAHILYYLNLESRATTQQHHQPPAVTSLRYSAPTRNGNVRRHLDDACYCLPLLKHRRAGVTDARQHTLTTVLLVHLAHPQSGTTLIMNACLRL